MLDYDPEKCEWCGHHYDLHVQTEDGMLVCCHEFSDQSLCTCRTPEEL